MPSSFCQVRGTGLPPAHGGKTLSDTIQDLTQVPPTVPGQAMKEARSRDRTKYRPPTWDVPAQSLTICLQCPLGSCWQPHYRHTKEAVSTARQNLVGFGEWGIGSRGKIRTVMPHADLPQFPFVPYLYLIKSCSVYLTFFKFTLSFSSPSLA